MHPDDCEQQQVPTKTVVRTADAGMLLPGRQINPETSAREFILTTRQLISHYGTIAVVVAGSLGINIIPGNDKESHGESVSPKIEERLERIEHTLDLLRTENGMLHGYGPLSASPMLSMPEEYTAEMDSSEPVEEAPNDNQE